ncbi:MAG: alanine racemase [Acidobacteria bacterium RIFCSPLOWO2_02_FULL_67_36]|nr:MAG: alanine racemase [Acidobacteria bacterium RIFCSPLOWO2_02_FULL_67_36]OFW20525.1 MAG: alanine racemase [Acidobacteria bacterium RIFCSPLOWO2_12_FULL_66_21]
MITSRRGFLKAASAVPALGSVREAGRPAAAQRVSPQIRDSSVDPWIEIDTARLRDNAAEIHRRVSGRPILAVIKNNGYGTGVVNIARALERLEAIHGFAVVKLHEAVTLRDAGITKPVLLMGPFDVRELRDVAARRIMPMVYTPIGDALDAVAGRAGRPVTLHVCVDTGIGRVGVPVRKAAPLFRDLAARRSVRIAGTMMTFTEDAAFDEEQLRRFEALLQELKANRINPGRRHAASSFALFQHPDGFLDMVRPGMAIYGAYSEPQFRTMGIMKLTPAVSLKARVAYVKQLEAGDSAGYERAYRTDRPVWIATIPVGHADGVPRSAAQGGRVRIGGASYPIVASISASHCIVEIGSEPRVNIGDEVTIFDGRDGSRPDDFAAASKSSVYDLLMHLHADLPRRVI